MYNENGFNMFFEKSKIYIKKLSYEDGKSWLVDAISLKASMGLSNDITDRFFAGVQQFTDVSHSKKDIIKSEN